MMRVVPFEYMKLCCTRGLFCQCHETETRFPVIQRSLQTHIRLRHIRLRHSTGPIPEGDAVAVFSSRVLADFKPRKQRANQTCGCYTTALHVLDAFVPIEGEVFLPYHTSCRLSGNYGSQRRVRVKHMEPGSPIGNPAAGH